MKLISVNELTPLDDNPRVKLEGEKLQQLIKSLERDPGLFEDRPLLVNDRSKKYKPKDSRWVIYGGNQRYFAAVAMGLTEVPCIVRTLDRKTERRRTVVDNVQQGSWDKEVLGSAWAEEPLGDWGLDFDVNAPGLGATGPDALPKRAPAVSRLGDIFALGKHRVMCGDSTDSVAVGRLFGRDTHRLCWTDPPYGVKYLMYSGIKGYEKIQETKRTLRKRSDDLTINGDDISGTKLTELIQKSLGLALEFATPGGVLYCCCASGDQMPHAMEGVRLAGYDLHHCLVWVKDRLALGRADYHYRHETIIYAAAFDHMPIVETHEHMLYAWKKGRHFFVKDRTQTSVFEVDKPQASINHPTMKPVELVERCIGNSSREGWIVYDPFLGSGTTLLASERLRRICYGVELDPHYCDVAIRRWEEYTGESAEKICETKKETGGKAATKKKTTEKTIKARPAKKTKVKTRRPKARRV